MDRVQAYRVEFTSRSREFYFSIVEYFYEYLSYESATRNARELYDRALSLNHLPERGAPELTLEGLKKGHRYLLYQSTSRKTIKIIYYVDKEKGVVYVTDFFPTEMDDKKIKDRTA